MSLLIGLLGRAGSGKSTAAKYLVEKYGAVKLSIATPLKELTKRIYEFTDEQVYGTQAQKEAVDPRWGISPREALIRLGDGARFVLGENIWIDACLNEAKRLRNDEGYELIVIDDVRYPNECQLIREWWRRGDFKHGFGAVVKLICPDAESTVNPNVASERSVDEVPASDVDFLIESNRSPGSVDLINKVDSVLGRINAARSGGV